MAQQSVPEQTHPSRWILVPGIILLILSYLYSQSVIQGIPLLPCGINDALQTLTAGINSYLHTHRFADHALTILYSALGDIAVVTLFVFMVIKASIRPILPLFIFMTLRQMIQLLVSLPIPPDLLWEYPGFPSLFSNYNIDNDFYFSAYVGINILATLYLLHLKKRWLTILGIAIILFEAFVDIVLRSHYTSDIYTSIVTAFSAYLIGKKLADPIDRWFQKYKSYRFCLIGSCLVGIVVYFLIAAVVSHKPIPACIIIDQIHILFRGINDYLFTHAHPANALLIIMNTILDLLTLFILGLTIWKKDVRPILTLTILLSLRQLLQCLVKLPLPPQTIWHYPGFPSLLQTYHISDDFYFSGHTGVSLLAAFELSYFHKRWLTILGFSIFFFEMISVLIMQIHYTMDVFTAIMTVTCIRRLAFKLAPPINRFLIRSSP